MGARLHALLTHSTFAWTPKRTEIVRFVSLLSRLRCSPPKLPIIMPLARRQVAKGARARRALRTWGLSTPNEGYRLSEQTRRSFRLNRNDAGLVNNNRYRKGARRGGVSIRSRREKLPVPSRPEKVRCRAAVCPLGGICAPGITQAFAGSLGGSLYAPLKCQNFPARAARTHRGHST